MNFIDFHCDTLSLLRYARNEGIDGDFKSDSRLQLNLDKLKKGGYMMQCFALYTNQQNEKNQLVAALEMIEIFHRQLEKYPDLIEQVWKYEDIERIKKAGKVGGLLTIEDLGCCLGNISMLNLMYDLGVRIATLTWNYENSIAFPNSMPEDSMTAPGMPNTVNGLKERGIEFVREMNRIGMIIDVSHLSDKGFWDVAEHTDRPFIASHSNARALSSHCRNLTDEMIRTIGDRGGLTGINYCSEFLDGRDIPDSEKQSTVKYMVDHMEYIRNKGGIDMIGLGSDFDGIEGNLEMYDCSCLPMLESEMKRRGFTDDEIDKISFGNAMRVLKEFL